MKGIGIVEGFFGPQWPLEPRKSYAEFLREYGGEFYIYAPKQDPFLRKKWRENWTTDYLSGLQDLVQTFHRHNIKFGVGFSPFGLGAALTSEDKKHLEEKLSLLNELGIDILGLFFDDMPTNENLAATQIETVKLVQNSFHQSIIFCPSYYTPDPILDKVFGKRPEGYLKAVGEGIPETVSIAWTGPKVISPAIDQEHLLETTGVLKRKPFLWENLFANDGPRNCKFLKLRPYSGRSGILPFAEGFGFNLMNQPELSKIVYLSSLLTLKGKEERKAFEEALALLCSEGLKAFLLKHEDKLLNKGLDLMTEEEKKSLLCELQDFKEEAAGEIRSWLQGDYNVGSECLTD